MSIAKHALFTLLFSLLTQLMELSVQKLILIRGLPGSGKSTQAQSLGLTHYEADMYFVDAQGQYRFCADQLPNAHRWCQTEVERSLAAGESVVVANTFVQRWEIKPYAKLAKRYGVSLEVRECSGQFNNIHGVSDETIQNMKKRWQTWPNDRPSLK